MKHLMDPLDFSVEELDRLFDLADDIAANPAKYAHAADRKEANAFIKFVTEKKK